MAAFLRLAMPPDYRKSADYDYVNDDYTYYYFINTVWKCTFKIGISVS